MSPNFPVSHTNETTQQSISGSDIYVQIDTAELERHLDAISPRKVAMASQRAATRTRDWLLTNLRRELGQQAALPVKGLVGRFKRGPKGGNSQFYSNEGFAILWIGLNAIEAQKAGTLHETKNGVRVGRHAFARAFVAEIYSGEKKVWKRKRFGAGSKRFPVVKMTIPINDAMEAVLPRYQVAAERMFSQRLEHEINYLLGLV